LPRTVPSAAPADDAGGSAAPRSVPEVAHAKSAPVDSLERQPPVKEQTGASGASADPACAGRSAIAAAADAVAADLAHACARLAQARQSGAATTDSRAVAASHNCAEQRYPRAGKAAGTAFDAASSASSSADVAGRRNVAGALLGGNTYGVCGNPAGAALAETAATTSPASPLCDPKAPRLLLADAAAPHTGCCTGRWACAPAKLRTVHLPWAQLQNCELLRWVACWLLTAQPARGELPHKGYAHEDSGTAAGVVTSDVPSLETQPQQVDGVERERGAGGEAPASTGIPHLVLLCDVWLSPAPLITAALALGACSRWTSRGAAAR